MSSVGPDMVEQTPRSGCRLQHNDEGRSLAGDASADADMECDNNSEDYAISRSTSWRSWVRPETYVKGYKRVLSGEIYSYLPFLTLPFVMCTAERDREGVTRTT
eukprot:67147-Heterocapsa_arctica.AAC.3